MRPNSPDKALLCLKIWDAVHAHHKEKTHGLGHHAPRRSIYDKEEGSEAQSAIGKKDVGYILRFGNVNAIQR